MVMVISVQYSQQRTINNGIFTKIYDSRKEGQIWMNGREKVLERIEDNWGVETVDRM